MIEKELEVKLFDWFDDHWYKIRYMDKTKVELR